MRIIIPSHSEMRSLNRNINQPPQKRLINHIKLIRFHLRPQIEHHPLTLNHQIKTFQNNFPSLDPHNQPTIILQAFLMDTRKWINMLSNNIIYTHLSIYSFEYVILNESVLKSLVVIQISLWFYIRDQTIVEKTILIWTYESK